MVLKTIENLLNRYIGLDAGTIGEPALKQAIHARMTACTLKSEPAYQELLRHSRQELNNLVEEVVVGETWFFRDAEPFRYLAKHLAEGPTAAGPWRVLSVACSTGEEPYSLAMTLLGAGFSLPQIRIDAVDISARALAKAARAVYTKNSFRGAELSYRDRFFHKTPEGYRLAEDVRRCVNFYHGNATEPGFLSGKTPYDVIFCRNLLIYLDPSTRTGMIRSLDRALKPGGLLFVGHAETSAVPHAQFVPIHDPHTFAFKKAVSPMASVASTPLRKKTAAHFPAKEKSAVPASHPALPVNKGSTGQAPPVQATPREKISLQHAAQLADRGELAAAAELCRKIMEQEGPTADGYNLLGIIREAENKLKEAEECFNKAVYLDHDHAEALTHLSLLLERRGLGARAANVRRHAERAGSAGGAR